MTKYLEATDPGAFTDRARKSARPGYGYTARCPLCKGYGGWNLKLNAYRLPAGQRNTKANRAAYCHFSCCCSQCNGWGWVHPSNVACVHEWQEVSAAKAAELGVPHFGNCYHVYVCTKGCGRTRATDSSG